MFKSFFFKPLLFKSFFKSVSFTGRGYINRLLLSVFLLSPLLVTASEPVTDSGSLSATALISKVTEITQAQNQVMLLNSTVADVDKLFGFYTEDFVYIHEVYGGTYSREKLYANTVKFLKAGYYKNTAPRYTISATIPGDNAIAVQRQETHNGVVNNHLAVFEFRGNKVAKIIEYWR